MLDFRLLIGAFVLGAAIIVAVVSSFDEGDISISSLGPRPGVATAAAPRLPPPPIAVPSNVIVIPAPIVVPVRTAKAGSQPPEITGSIAAGDEAASRRPRVAAKKKESEELFFNPLRVFFPLLFEGQAN